MDLQRTIADVALIVVIWKEFCLEETRNFWHSALLIQYQSLIDLKCS